MNGRAALASRFEREARPLKTWVLDAHVSIEADSFIPELSGSDARVEREDATLWRIDVEDDLVLFADTLSDRYWRMHSWSSAGRAGGWIKAAIETSPLLDRAWLPAGHLRAVGSSAIRTRVKTDFGGLLRPHRGSHSFEAEGAWAEDLYAWLAEHDEFGSMASVDSVEFTATSSEDSNRPAVAEKVDRWGRFLAHGWDFKAHERHVSHVVRRYKKLVDLIEGRSLAVRGLPRSGYSMTGSPVTMRFDMPIPDVDFFMKVLFSCREPFRLFGTPREADGFWRVEAGDLHVGQRIPLDIGTTWLRAYVHEGMCGNTIARLASNLEHHLDARVRFSDPELQAAFAPDQDARPAAA